MLEINTLGGFRHLDEYHASALDKIMVKLITDAKNAVAETGVDGDDADTESEQPPESALRPSHSRGADVTLC